MTTSLVFSETASNELGEKARRMLPPGNPDFRGGTIAFTMKVDPGKSKLFYSEVTGALNRMKQPARNG